MKYLEYVDNSKKQNLITLYIIVLFKSLRNIKDVTKEALRWSLIQTR